MKLIKRLLTLFTAAALLVGMMLVSTGVVSASGTVNWTGQGTTDGDLNSTECDSENNAYLLWIFTLGGGGNTVTSAVLTVNSDVYDNGQQFGNEYHFLTDSYDLDTVAASVDYEGNLGTGRAGLRISHGCPGDEESVIASITTAVHLDGYHTTDIQGTNIPLGSSVHDSGTIETLPVDANLPTGSTVTFYFFEDDECGAFDPANAVDSAPYLVSGTDRVVDPALAEGPLGAGDYSYYAFFESSDTDVVTNAQSTCEPFTVDKGNVTIRTDIHDAAHAIVLSVAAGSVVHDTATIGGSVAGFDPDMTQVSFTFYTNAICDGAGTAVANTGTESTYVARSAVSAALAAGHYSYSASFAGDDNYNPVGPATCEPLSVFQPGKTMGFWGNKNGIARILANGGYAANAVNIGRGAVINTQAESLKVLPKTLNACGKGNPIIFSDQTVSANCSLASGININSLNTLAAQTLALGYNIKLVAGYDGQTIGDLGCSPVGSLTTSSTVGDAFAAAVALINGSASGGTTTQSQIGAMNTLLGCLNSEA